MCILSALTGGLEFYSHSHRPAAESVCVCVCVRDVTLVQPQKNIEKKHTLGQRKLSDLISVPASSVHNAAYLKFSDFTLPRSHLPAKYKK